MDYPILSIKDHVIAARDYAEFSRDSLQQALKQASPVEAILLLELINQVSNVRNQLFNLSDALRYQVKS